MSEQIFKVQLPIAGTHYEILFYNEDRSEEFTVEDEEICREIAKIVNNRKKSFWWISFSPDPANEGGWIANFIREADWQDW